MSTFLLLLSAASAEDLHVGVPVRGVEGLGEPQFLTPEVGWSAPLADGFVKVFVGRSTAEAAAWTEQARMTITVTLPALTGIGDEAWGDPSGLVVLRDNNVAIQVRDRAGNAMAIAETMLAAIPEEPSAWPEEPELVALDWSRWHVKTPGAVSVQLSGGGEQRVTGDGELVVSTRPEAVVAWDAWGRPAVLTD